LDIRCGIHTGKVVAGIIGSKVVRYDIFGEGVLICKSVEKEGVVGKVSISDDTKNILMKQPDIAQEYLIQDHVSLKLSAVDRVVKTYTIERKETTSLNDDPESDNGNSMDSS